MAGLAVRIWAIVVLGQSFRTTVEVDTGQRVVDRGPYRWVRHPSYTGILLLMVGLSLVYGNWPALAVLLVLPAGVLIHRIFVEEAALTEVIGRAYTDYAARTKRLVPGVCVGAVRPLGVRGAPMKPDFEELIVGGCLGRFREIGGKHGNRDGGAH